MKKLRKLPAVQGNKRAEGGWGEGGGGISVWASETGECCPN